MAQLLKVGERDLSQYIRTQHEDGLDPANPEYAEPQFAGSSAFGEGQSYAGDSVGNRMMAFPLILKAASTDALYELVRSINAELSKGKQIEYRSGGAGRSTFFDLETGRLEPEFQFWLDQGARTRAVLHLWVRPRGHTGTTRLVASIPAGSAALVQFPATGVLGDEPALANLEVRVGSAVASSGRVVMYGVHPHPSFQALHRATSGLAQAGATVRGASGALGSQYTAIPVSPTGASGISYTAFLAPPDAHVGRHRVIALGRSGLSQPIALFAEDRFGARLGATALATQTDQAQWQILDLGEIQVPSRMSGQEPVPTQFVAIRAGGEGGVINASPAFHLGALIFLPLDHAAGVLRTPGAGGLARVLGDSFARLQNDGGHLYTSTEADEGGQWKELSNAPFVGVGTPEFAPAKPARLGPVVEVLASPAYVTNAASGRIGGARLASGRQLTDIKVAMPFRLGGSIPSSIASGAFIELWPKEVPGPALAYGQATQGLRAKLVLGPTQSLSLFSTDGSGATTLHASAGIASTLASGIWLGQQHTLTINVLGGRAEVWLATGGLSVNPPVLSASHANIALAGNPAWQIQNGAASGNNGLWMEAFRVDSLAAGASDIGAREYFRFESYPERRVIQGNASVYVADRHRDHRGQLPRIYPVGSPAATGPAQVVVFQGEIDNVVGNDGPNIALAARERFTYLR